MFKWLKNIFAKLGGKTEIPTQKRRAEVPNVDPMLEVKINAILEKKGRITTTPTDWFTVEIPNPDPKPEIAIFQPMEIEVESLAEIKARRIAAEHARIKAAEEAARYKLAEAKVHIQTESVEAADAALNAAYTSLQSIKNQNLLDDYRQLRRDVTALRETLRQREIERQEAERRAREEAERKRREEEEERQRKFLAEKKKEEERKRKEREKYEAELRKKEEKEREAKSKLDALTNNFKDDKDEIQRILSNNGIEYLYHFTSRLNLEPIRNHGGLYSWKYCEKNHIVIPEPGGDQQSRALDSIHGLEDYVRLSFCDDHPMAYRLRDKDLVLLKIKKDVAWFKGTQFSDINAAAMDHHHGGKVADLQRVDFRAVKKHFVSRSDDDFHAHQAEVLVKTFIPKDFIVNLDNPIEMNFG